MLITSIIGLLAGIVAVSLAGFLSARGAARRRDGVKKAYLAGSQSVQIRPAGHYQEASRNRDNPEAMKTAAGGKANEGFPLVSTGSR